MPIVAITTDVPFASAPHTAASSVGNKVRIHVPANFDAKAPFRLCIFLHGWEVSPGSREAQIGQAVAQMVKSRKNIMLIAPRFGTRSEEGSFRNVAAFSTFVLEIESVLPRVLEQSGMDSTDAANVATAAARQAQIVIVAFSGGWLPLGVILKGLLALPASSGVRTATRCADRVAAVVLLDCIYGTGSASAVVDWNAYRGEQTALLSIYGRDTGSGSAIAASKWNSVLLDKLRPGDSVLTPSQWSALPSPFPVGYVAFFEVPTPHLSIPTKGPPTEPIATFLSLLA